MNKEEAVMNEYVIYNILPELYQAYEMYKTWAIMGLELDEDITYYLDKMARIVRLIDYYKELS